MALAGTGTGGAGQIRSRLASQSAYSASVLPLPLSIVFEEPANQSQTWGGNGGVARGDRDGGCPAAPKIGQRKRSGTESPRAVGGFIEGGHLGGGLRVGGWQVEDSRWTVVRWVALDSRPLTGLCHGAGRDGGAIRQHGNWPESRKRSTAEQGRSRGSRMGDLCADA